MTPEQERLTTTAYQIRDGAHGVALIRAANGREALVRYLAEYRLRAELRDKAEIEVNDDGSASLFYKGRVIKAVP